jgi:hypothetical protein
VRMWQKTVIAVVGVVGSIAVTSSAAGAVTPGHDIRWTGTWAASMIARGTPPFGQGPANWSVDGFANQSVRQVVRVSRDGSSIRIRLSNRYGTTPLRLTGASLGLAGDGASVRRESTRALTFDRSRSAVVPPGGEAVSAAVRMRISSLQRLSVTLFFAAPTGSAAFHLRSFATSYQAPGDHRRDEGAAAFAKTTTSWYYLTGIDVAGAVGRGGGAIVAFGNSITDGAVSTTDANDRYPDALAERLNAARRPIGVLNAGIATNQALGTFPAAAQAHWTGSAETRSISRGRAA